MAYPANYKYTKEHEWIALENSTAGTTGSIGITDYAQNSLGDIVFVELPKLGDTLEAGKTLLLEQDICAQIAARNKISIVTVP